MDYKKLTAEQVAMLNEPLPAKALKQHPTKAFLTTINSIYVTERLNNVFGVGAWRVKPELQEADGKMVVVKTTLTIPEYGIEYECYGGNDNADRGDAYKGAVTDAITKIGSWLGIGADVWKNEAGKNAPAQKTAPKPQPVQPQVQVSRKMITSNTLANKEQNDKMLALLESEMRKNVDGMRDFSPIVTLQQLGFEFEAGCMERVANLWYSYVETLRSK